MILRVLGVSLIGLTLAGCVNNDSLSGDVYSASEAKQVQNVTYGTIVNARPVQIQGGDENNVMQANLNVAEATLKQAQWQLTQTVVQAPVDGWVTNLSTREGNYATTGQPVFALVDSHSFYIVGYFEETKLRHIREGAPATITLYSGSQTLQGHVSSIGRAIYDQSVETDSGLVPDIKPNVPWVRLAQRVPVRVEFDRLPQDLTLVSGTTCTVSIGTRQ